MHNNHNKNKITNSLAWKTISKQSTLRSPTSKDIIERN